MDHHSQSGLLIYQNKGSLTQNLINKAYGVSPAFFFIKGEYLCCYKQGTTILDEAAKIDLTTIQTVEVIDPEKFIFNLNTKGGFLYTSYHSFQAETKADFDAWVTALTNVIHSLQSNESYSNSLSHSASLPALDENDFDYLHRVVMGIIHQI